jgi:hypothetical protein
MRIAAVIGPSGFMVRSRRHDALSKGRASAYCRTVQPDHVRRHSSVSVSETPPATSPLISLGSEMSLRHTAEHGKRHAGQSLSQAMAVATEAWHSRLCGSNYVYSTRCPSTSLLFCFPPVLLRTFPPFILLPRSQSLLVSCASLLFSPFSLAVRAFRLPFFQLSLIVDVAQYAAAAIKFHFVSSSTAAFWKCIVFKKHIFLLHHFSGNNYLK